MNLKKLAFILTSVFVMMAMMLLPNISNAATLQPPLYLGVQEFRNNTTPANMAYGIGNPDRNGSTPSSIIGAKIWDIVKYNSLSDTNYDNSLDYYCVKAGVGFRDTGDKATYNVFFNYKTERDAILAMNNPILDSIVNTDNDAYYNIMALADLLYLSGVSSDEFKADLLKAAGIHEEEFSIDITDTDIKAIQQAALWYFTNYDDEIFERVYNQLERDTWFTYKTESMSEYSSLSDYDLSGEKAGEQRQIQAVRLYKYLINTAKTKGINYKNGTAISTTKITLYANTSNMDQQPVILVEREEVGEFDMALRKYITKIDGVALDAKSTRIPNIDESTLGNETTATYKHRKDPVAVKSGTKVTYHITVYNEGDKEGRVTKIVDQLPTGLKFTRLNTNGFTSQYDQTKNQVIFTRNSDNQTNLAAYQPGQLKAETLELECEVTQKEDKDNSIVLTNVAWIAEEYDAVGNEVIINEKGADRDSEPATVPSVNKDNMTEYTGNGNKTDLTDKDNYYKGQQDDDDFEKLILAPKAFDLKLIKRIVDVNGVKVPERIENVDVSKLNTIGEDGKKITTAEYQLNKDPVLVKQGDVVKYTFRIYNEGDIDGYAQEISEDIPEGLEFLWSEKSDGELAGDITLTTEEKNAIKYNQGIWDIKQINQESGKIELISTDYLAKGKGAEIITNDANLIKAFDSTTGYLDTENEKNPDYKEVSVYLKVTENNRADTIIRNEAAITADADADGNEVDDRDSNPDNWVKYEDDEDYDNIELQSFDLALRKFITGVNDKNVDSRIPQVNYDKENNKITYAHTKVPVEVVNGDTVVYTLRVFNEGKRAGYAKAVADNLPKGIEFLPNHDLNKEYRWVMYDKDGNETTDVAKAEKIVTDYLSKAQGEERMKKDSSLTENPNLLQPFDSDQEISKTNPDYRDVQVAFKVTEPNTSNSIITNLAQIDDDEDEKGNDVDDEDSNPGQWIDGEDDQDEEHIKLTYFDLALRKWVTQAIVIEDGKETVTNTGHTPEQDPEPAVKVEIDKKKLDKIMVKFRYSIRVRNEGNIPGYAKQLKDYIPEGLKFVAADNPGWKEEGNNVISTRLLENTLLQPGEYADVEILLTWINGKDNLGLKINTAEISEDYNDKEAPDIDSTPDNQKPGEDDIDDAPVILGIKTGQARIYYTLGFIILVTLGGGIILIKKFVL